MDRKYVDIYRLALHEEGLVSPDVKVMRVHNGWGYTRTSANNGGSTSISSWFAPETQQRQPVKSISEIITAIIDKVIRWKASIVTRPITN